MFVVKRNYFDETKEILRQLNGTRYYTFDKVYIDIVNQIVKCGDSVFYDVHHNIISELIHAFYEHKIIEYVIFGKGGLNE